MYLGTFAICYTDIFRKSTKMIVVSKSLSTQIASKLFHFMSLPLYLVGQVRRLLAYQG